MTEIKICGLNDEAAVTAAADADYAGFIFFPRSPRYVTPERAGALARGLPKRVRRVAVIVDLDDRTIAGIVAGLAPDLLQLHGRETPERANELRARFGVGIIKVSSVATPADIDAATRYESVVDMLMFDAKPPPRPDALPGGNATRFDWSLLAGRGFARPWILSGGLDPANVGDAIRATNPTAVDVSSGVESRPGVKNPERIRAFLAAIRDTAAQA